MVTSLGGYPTFNYQVAGYGGELHQIPYRDDRSDLDGLLAKVHDTGAKLVYLANPDNPMGTWHDGETVQNFVEALPQGVTLLLDEAYIEFAPLGVSCPTDSANPRLVRMRTFSKAHGMAGARIGYVVANKEHIVSYNKIRNHFAVNRIAQEGALASLEDDAFIKRVIEEVAKGREEYHRLALSLNIGSIESAANFVCFDVGAGKRGRTLLKALEAHGVFVRMPGVVPLDRCIRVTVGTPPERAQFTQVFQAILPTVPE